MVSYIKVLHLEDNCVDAEVIKRMLSKSRRSDFEVTWRDTLDSAMQAIGVERFDVILLDRGLPGIRDFEALVALRKLDERIPIIMVTDFNDEEVALKSLDHGGQDYLIKGHLTTDSLVRAI